MKDYFLLTVSFLGFANVLYLYLAWMRFKKKGKKIYCFLGGDCGKVIGSKYGETIGLKNEIIAMAYYLEMFLYGVMRLVTPSYTGGNLRENMIILPVIALVYSLYFLYLQRIKLKTYCSWCLVAIGINGAILASVL